MKTNSNEVFTAYGEIGVIEGKRKFVPTSPAYVRDRMSRMRVGQKCAMTITETKSVRSPAQLAYHWVLMAYISEYTGNSKEEMHDAVMRIKFGEKDVSFGKYRVKVRKSLAETARMSKSDVIELIQFDLDLCNELEIRVPTAQELGYVPNTKSKLS